MCNCRNGHISCVRLHPWDSHVALQQLVGAVSGLDVSDVLTAVGWRKDGITGVAVLLEYSPPVLGPLVQQDSSLGWQRKVPGMRKKCWFIFLKKSIQHRVTVSNTRGLKFNISRHFSSFGHIQYIVTLQEMRGGYFSLWRKLSLSTWPSGGIQKPVNLKYVEA